MTLAQNPALTCSLYRLRACAWRAGSKGRAAVACCCCCCWSPLLLPHTCGVAAEQGPPGCLPPHAVVGGVWRPRGVTGCCCCCCRAAGQEGLSPPLSLSPMVGGGRGGGYGWLLTWRGGDVRTLGRLARNWEGWLGTAEGWLGTDHKISVIDPAPLFDNITDCWDGSDPVYPTAAIYRELAKLINRNAAYLLGKQSESGRNGDREDGGPPAKRREWDSNSSSSQGGWSGPRGGGGRRGGGPSSGGGYSRFPRYA